MTLQSIIEQRRRNLGGFEVGRVLPSAKRHMIGPFIFFDHFGPAEFARGIPRTVDVRPHPHIGLSTVTYLLEGEIMHRDSVGSEQAIRPGEVNWMVAGRGITHSERFEKARAEGGLMHGIQAWVALPREHEEAEPHFANYSGGALPTHSAKGVWMRLVAGEIDGMRAGAVTHSPMFYAHVELEQDSTLSLPDQYAERAAFVVSGSVSVDGRVFNRGQMLIFVPHGDAIVRASTPATLMILGGEPLGERYIDWNFVSSSKERIEQAKADWRAGRMKLPDLDHDEFIPLPPEPQAQA
ncbi:MAG TPA: pirin family protein, partial [Burkholderiaceae bacterium]|nr:pirin family protein [Burkholderiaceae bacterium]